MRINLLRGDYMPKEPLLMKNRDEFIDENKGFIYTIASKICNKKLDWNNDDELSVAIIAFNTACDTYNEDKGNFSSYAKVVIKNALIDYFRKAKVAPYLMFREEEAQFDYADIKNSLSEYEKNKENDIRANEILELSKELMKYKLSFSELVNTSPSHYDTRNTLLNLAFKCSKQQSIVDYIVKRKNLPVKEIMLLTAVNRKLIEKWRKYILVLIIIFSSDEYPYIKSYFNIKAGEYNE